MTTFSTFSTNARTARETERALERLRLIITEIAAECTSISASIVTDHDGLGNLDWSAAGHAMDADLDMDGNHILDTRTLTLHPSTREPAASLVLDYSGAFYGCNDAVAYYRSSATLTTAPLDWAGTEFVNASSTVGYNTIAVNDALYATIQSGGPGQYPQFLGRFRVPKEYGDATFAASITVDCYGITAGGGPNGVTLKAYNATTSTWDLLDSHTTATFEELTGTINGNHINADDTSENVVYILVYGPVHGSMPWLPASLYIDYVSLAVGGYTILDGQRWCSLFSAPGIKLLSDAQPLGFISNRISQIYARCINVGNVAAYDPTSPIYAGVTSSASDALVVLRGNYTYTGSGTATPLYFTGSTTAESSFIYSYVGISAWKATGTTQWIGYQSGNAGTPVPYAGAGAPLTNTWQVYGVQQNLRMNTTGASSLMYGAWLSAQNLGNAGTVCGMYATATGGTAWSAYCDNGNAFIANVLQIGSNSSPDHATAPGFGWFTDDLEVDGRIWCDGPLRIEVKTTTGDKSSGMEEGDIVLNTFNNNVKIYEDSAWRQIAAW